jgi:branched-chain amino acid transport system permease protein
MAVVLVIRPRGFFGKAPPPQAAVASAAEPLIRPTPRALLRLGALALAAAVLLPPFLAGDYGLIVLTDMAIAVLFAASLHFIMGPGGMASFGHAAYFGIGAYGAALLAKWASASMLPGLAVAPLAAGLAGIVFGFFCVRLSGVYAAMLTLAFAQIAWSVAFQWVEVTGGDNGVLGVWPDPWADKLRFYYLALALCLGGTLLLRRVIHSPFGYALRAQRDNALRAEAIGINGFGLRWAGFTLAAAMAGIAGGLFAYAKGSVFPTALDISRSVDALLMVLLGGVQTLSGPIVGALAFTGLQEELVKFTDFWRLVLGLVILLLVLAFPQGLAGAARQAWEARPRGEAGGGDG